MTKSLIDARTIFGYAWDFLKTNDGVGNNDDWERLLIEMGKFYEGFHEKASRTLALSVMMACIGYLKDLADEREGKSSPDALTKMQMQLLADTLQPGATRQSHDLEGTLIHLLVDRQRRKTFTPPPRQPKPLQGQETSQATTPAVPYREPVHRPSGQPNPTAQMLSGPNVPQGRASAQRTAQMPPHARSQRPPAQRMPQAGPTVPPASKGMSSPARSPQMNSTQVPV